MSGRSARVDRAASRVPAILAAALPLAVPVLLALSSGTAAAQQYVTDDAGLTEYRACQMQMWAGQRSTWMLPVCTPIRNLELSLGFIAVWRDGGTGHFEYAAQAKTAFRALRTDSWGAGFVVGTGRDPAFAGTAAQSYNLYAYVPVSRSFAHDALIVDENTGLIYERRAGAGRTAFTWALRADTRLTRHLTLVTEGYGADGVGTGHYDTPPEFQVGLRVWLRTNHVQLDGSYGGRLEGHRTGRDGPGFTLGLTLITPPFL